MIVSVEQLTKTYPLPDKGELPVLTGCSFSMDKGDTLAITGQSGSGKSTLLSLIAGLDRPDSGHVTIDDTDLVGMAEDRLTRFRARKIGIVFQQFHLMPHLTTEENIRLPLEILRIAEVERKTATMLDRVGLGERRHHLPRQLSGGECQRVAIARALVVEPAVLLADEPTGNLDVTTGAAVSNLLFDLVGRDGMTLIVVTHNPELAGRCRKRLHLDQGRLT